ncbi:hypothetical protein SPRG_12708 [Saprolegnia parasitica CBS 223.65]|uniref:F-box domain-containing protein n=1 Tax=Saprolegnia parasitica (strain CBS 223.65) TaxID=695850 RepID=A0A067BVW8_SAPPC|nr:hypothetical protein SPRG_12708 [Saprolegnia parasitica CBS 223.65]KDO22428.1 hypothetical protein SPRG_12708 [Saprolegnia parasitica CBS 223.65]|eukprot:XP_012206817.1 hypothetical protein SPRG_12708 [Saprolegnia parasitica CBS 223.65]
MVPSATSARDRTISTPAVATRAKTQGSREAAERRLIADLQLENATYKEEITELEDELEAMEDMTKELTDARKRLTQAAIERKEVEDTWQKQVQALEKQHKAKKIALKKQLQTQRASVETMTTSIEDVRQQLADEKDRVADLERQLRDETSTSRSWKDRFEQLSAQIATAEQEEKTDAPTQQQPAIRTWRVLRTTLQDEMHARVQQGVGADLIADWCHVAPAYIALLPSQSVPESSNLQCFECCICLESYKVGEDVLTLPFWNGMPPVLSEELEKLVLAMVRPLPDLVRWQLVCKRWRRLLTDPTWLPPTVLDMDVLRPLSAAQYAALLQRWRGTTVLQMTLQATIPHEQQWHMDIGRHLDRLCELRLRTTSTKAVLAILTHCRQLHTLELLECRSLVLPKLPEPVALAVLQMHTATRLMPTTLANFLRKCPELKSLTITGSTSRIIII